MSGWSSVYIHTFGAYRCVCGVGGGHRWCPPHREGEGGGGGFKSDPLINLFKLKSDGLRLNTEMKM